MTGATSANAYIKEQKFRDGFMATLLDLELESILMLCAYFKEHKEPEGEDAFSWYKFKMAELMHCKFEIESPMLQDNTNFWKMHERIKSLYLQKYRKEVEETSSRAVIVSSRNNRKSRKSRK